MPSNLFDFAPTELSQDAFFCWLLAWADARHANVNPSCHRAGLAFLNALIASHGQPLVGEVTVNVQRQLDRADIVVEVDNTIVLAIEDKVHAGLHGAQLEQYKRRFPTLLERSDLRRAEASQRFYQQRNIVGLCLQS